jgi:hypothetical protein
LASTFCDCEHTRAGIHYDVTLGRFCVAIGAVEERRLFHILSVFVALITQHAKRMRRIELSFVACPTVPYLLTLSHKRHCIRKNIIEHKMFVDFLYNFRLKRFSL